MVCADARPGILKKDNLRLMTGDYDSKIRFGIGALQFVLRSEGSYEAIG